LCLIESGLWYDDPVSIKAREETSKEPDKWRISVAFLPNPMDRERNVDVKGRRVNNVFHSIAILERSILPARYSANPFSRITTEGALEMQDHKIAVLREVLGDELADVVIAQADGINAKSVEPDAIFKELSRDELQAKLLEMSDGMEDPKQKAFLKSVAVFVSHGPEQVEKEEPEPDPNDLFIQAMGDLPDCELKDAFLELAEKARNKKEDDEDEEDEEEEVVAQSKEDNPSDQTSDESEVMKDLVKQMSDKMSALSLEVQALQGSQSTRASLVRPSADPGNVDLAATVAAKEKADQEDGGNAVVQGITDAVVGTFLGGNQSG
jgi:hypothetical protein